MGDIVEVDDSTWESIVEKGARRVAVMIHSPTCAYCAQIEPYFKEQAKELKGKALFARLNTPGSSYTSRHV